MHLQPLRLPVSLQGTLVWEAQVARNQDDFQPIHGSKCHGFALIYDQSSRLYT